MSRQIMQPICGWTDEVGKLLRWKWREATYSGRILSWWKLSDTWWDADRYSDRTYYRMETRDHQIFELYRDAAKDGLRVLARIQD